MENLRASLESDFASAKEQNDFTSVVFSKANSVMNRCAEDTEFPLADRDFDHANFGWFANCV